VGTLVRRQSEKEEATWRAEGGKGLACLGVGGMHCFSPGRDLRRGATVLERLITVYIHECIYARKCTGSVFVHWYNGTCK
jgi:hypothetical protein